MKPTWRDPDWKGHEPPNLIWLPSDEDPDELESIQYCPVCGATWLHLLFELNTCAEVQERPNFDFGEWQPNWERYAKMIKAPKDP